MSIDPHEYLGEQARLVFPKELAHLPRFGMRDAHSILELGCGPGWVTQALLAAFPQSTITALDNDPAMLAAARGRVPDADRVRWLEAGVESTGLDAGAYDVAYARFVFHHVADPLGAAREAFRLVKPGGSFIVTGGDDALFGLTTPEVPALRLVLERVAGERARKGGDRFRGRQLRPILEEAGFRDVELVALAIDSVEAGREHAVLPLRADHLRRLVDAGLLTPAEEAGARAARESFLADPQAYGVRIVLLACGRKPLED